MASRHDFLSSPLASNARKFTITTCRDVFLVHLTRSPAAACVPIEPSKGQLSDILPPSCFTFVLRLPGVEDSHCCLCYSHLTTRVFCSSELLFLCLSLIFSLAIAILEPDHSEDIDPLDSPSYFRFSSESAVQALAMATLAPMNRPTRQPLGALGGARLRNLGQVKNKQNGEKRISVIVHSGVISSHRQHLNHDQFILQTQPDQRTWLLVS